MNLFKTIKKYFAVGNASFNSPSWLWSSGITTHQHDRNLTPDEVGTLTAVHRAATLYSDSISAAEWHIAQRLNTGGIKNVTGTDSLSALRNWAFSDREFFIFSSVILGNGYAILTRNERGGILHIQSVASWRVSLEWNDNQLFYRVAGDESMNDKAEQIIPAADMLHLKFRVTGKHSLLGESPLTRLLPALDAVLRTREGQAAVFKNLAAPGAYYTTPKPLGPAAAQRLKTAIQERTSGKGLGKSIVLDNELEAKAFPIAETINLQLVELAQFGIDEVARAFGVPSSLLSKTIDINNASSAQESKHFATISLAPFAHRLSDCIAEKLFTRQEIGAGWLVNIDLLPLLLASGEETANYYSKLVNGGIIAPNESRNKLGFEDVDGGETLRAPVNTVPIDYWNDEYKPGTGSETDKQLSNGREKLMNIMGQS